MKWLIINALSRDVERQQLNKVLADIKSTTDTTNTNLTKLAAEGVSVGSVFTGGVQKGIIVTYSSQSKKANFVVNPFNITLTGDVTGTGLVQNNSDVSIHATIDPSLVGIGEAPEDNQYYVRRNAAWYNLALTNDVTVTLGEVRRRVSIGR